MIKKKTLFKNISIFLCLVPMLILSLFCLVPKKQNINVSAANVVEDFNFVGSNLIVPITMYYYTGETVENTFVKNTVFFGMSNGTYYIRFAGDLLTSLDSDTYYDETINLSENINNLAFGQVCELFYSSTHFIRFYVSMEGNITSSIDRISISNDYSVANYNIITYYDSFNNSLSIRFDCHKGEGAGDIRFSNRTYYLNNINTDDGIYQNGYTNGYNAGLSDGSSSGYTDGYNAGQTIGYDNGYSAGVLAGGDYTFMSLIGAVIDAPVSAFTNLLNFELLGINILGFITGLLTLAIIIFIIKLCMGGK